MKIGTIMKKRELGRTGIRITELGFGACPIGGTLYGKVDLEESKAVITKYVEAGGNFIDTARGYYESERLIGEVLSELGNSTEVFVATKTYGGQTEQGIPQMRQDLDVIM